MKEPSAKHKTYGMKRLSRSLILLIFIVPTSFAYSQDTLSALLQRASNLRNVGESRASVALLQQFLQKDSAGVPPLELGKAWNLLGASYQDAGLFRDAAPCHEKAIQLLRDVTHGKAELASALDNLGSVENWIGTPEASRSLRKASYHLYEEIADQAGLARTANNLAAIAIHDGDFKVAKRYATSALENAKRSSELDGDDRAALESVAGTIALHDGRVEAAIDHLRRAIAFWTQKHGEQHFLVGLGYSLRAQAFATHNERKQALSDMNKALDIEANVAGKESAIYWQTERVHASLARDLGDSDAASRIEREADVALAHIKRVQCAGCVTTVSGFQTHP